MTSGVVVDIVAEGRASGLWLAPQAQVRDLIHAKPGYTSM